MTTVDETIAKLIPKQEEYCGPFYANETTVGNSHFSFPTNFRYKLFFQ